MVEINRKDLTINMIKWSTSEHGVKVLLNPIFWLGYATSELESAEDNLKNKRYDLAKDDVEGAEISLSFVEDLLK